MKTSNWALFGGSFNPPHQGHVQIVRQLLQQSLDGIVLMPNAQSPLKSGTSILPSSLRWQMLEKIFQNWPTVELSNMELLRPPPSYTSHTLQQLKKEFPERTWRLILGMDNYLLFPQWHDTETILQICTLWVIDRPGKSLAVSERVRPIQALRPNELFELQGNLLLYNSQEMVRFLDLQTPEISSSMIRDVPQERKWIPKEARSLYQAYLANQN